MDDISAPFFKADFPQKSLVFDDVEELRRWIDAEWGSWTWMFNNIGQSLGNTFLQLINQYQNGLGNLRNLLNQWPANAAVSLQQKEQFYSALTNLFSANNVLFSDHPYAVIARDVANRISPQAGAGALASLLNIECTINLAVIRGVIEAGLLRDGISPTSPQLLSIIITKINSDANDEAQKRRADIASVVDANQRFLDEGKAAQAVTATDFKERTSAAMTTLNEDAHAAIQSIKEIEASYREQMKLQAPVEYWENKATSHRIAISGSRQRLIIFTVLGTTALAFGLVWLAVKASEIVNDKAPDSTAIYLKFAAIGAVVTTIVFWIARVMLRIYLSDRHLLTDAEERVAMIKTYLALSHEGKVEATDRALVLAPIFRSAADGIVKEEGPDASLAGIIARAIDVKGR
jgi:hypothetical protein